ncbi:MAG TPA: DUF3795 domain-containing protein [Candidatus Marinimicrobia bacterium]|nr:DUF3795 domain-containing protein [Candidatus Neomarinimicrobiota bacterium]
MIITKLIAPCGMNCALCMAFQREKNHCSGCNLDNENKPKSCVRCIIVNCELRKQTASGFCYECSKFPCHRMKQLDKRYRTKYRMSMLENLEYIRLNGLKRFIGFESERWRCQNCGQLVSVHRTYCLHCGVDTSAYPV